MQKQIVAAGALAALFALGSLFTGSPVGQATAQGQAQGAAPVRIVSPLPVPVTGTSTVSGTVAASQSGAWNVAAAQAGAWNVAASQAGTWNVNVANTASNPIPAILETGQPIHRWVSFDLDNGNGNILPVQVYEVPFGKVLTIEDVSYVCATETVSAPQSLVLYVAHKASGLSSPVDFARRYLDATEPISATGVRTTSGGETLKVNATAGVVGISATRTSGQGRIFCTFHLNGVLNNQ
jgi:hypothetical protein